MNIFIYELMDGGTGDDNDEDNYGLFHTDGTAKAAATSIHNMTTILAATNTSGNSTSSPTPTVSGLSSTGNSLALVNGVGGYDVLVWDEGNGSTATINLGASYTTVNVYDPVQGTSPIQTFNNVSQVTLQVSTDLLIVEAQ